MQEVRRPVVAGQFYAADGERLLREIETCYMGAAGPGELPSPPSKPAAGDTMLVVPHAGYVYSGAVAAWGWAEAARRGRPEAVVILGPNHRWPEATNAVDTGPAWRTPLGDAPIDGDLVRRLLEASPLLERSREAFAREHSLEVQVPFLQQALPGVPFVPLMVSTHRVAELEALGAALASVLPTPSLIVASTDMSHSLSAEEAERADRPAIEAIGALNPHDLADSVRRGGITMCGWAATVVAMVAVRARGIAGCRILRYATSGDVTGDRGSVVAYLAAIAPAEGGE